MDITGASAIVTGGASGLGEATARLLAQRGCTVVVLDLQDDKGAKVAAEIGGAYVRADVADEEQMRAVVGAARQRFGAIAGVIHAAGVLDDAGKLPLEGLDKFNAAIRRLGSASSHVYVADAYGHFLGHGASVGEEHRWYWRRSLIELNAAGANELRKLWLETLREAVYE